MTFELAREHIKSLYSELLNLPPALPFEQRLRVVELDFALEDLLCERRVGVGGTYNYCLFVNALGIRHTRLSPQEADVARKILTEESLSREEKDIALRLLRRL